MISKTTSILVINSGSTSLKYKLFAYPSLRLKKEKVFRNISMAQFNWRKLLTNIKQQENIIAVGHRVVHGGEKFYQPTIITKSILKELKQYNSFALLHNPYNLAGIKASQTYLSGLPNIAVFDTAWFTHIPDYAKIYPLPLKFYRRYKIKRYGFHGISHQYAAEQSAKRLKQPLKKLNLITCHLGGGSSITAVKRGKAIDTSMGFSTLEGLMMISRPGNVDSGIILYLQQVLKMSVKQVAELLYYQSGIKGMSGYRDYLSLLTAACQGNKIAKLTWSIYLYQIKKYIGAYMAILGKVDAIIFTGAIGAGKALTRRKICQNISLQQQTKILAILPDEELAIAQEVKKIIK